MKHFVGGHLAADPGDLLDLALGTPLDLWLGVDGESATERAAREAAARDILADDPGLPDRTLRVAAGVIEANPHLLHLPTRPRPLRPARTVRVASRRGTGAGVAA
jgi:hypothetical protein